MVIADQALFNIRLYLQKQWYKGHSDTGYWSFEPDALVKIPGLDDNSLKE
ncbi:MULTISPECIES: PoNe immunity protein domain-containing protein [unclassified Sphingobacterium]|nr:MULTISPECIES: PoNe immunity protein domain-containing protein [unclassified Sphingobacterium]